jgi:hypothetical protein
VPVRSHPDKLANKGKSEQVIAIYRRFLNIYVELHDTEPRKTLHSNHESFIGYYKLAQAHDTAAYPHLDVVEAWKMCLRICEKLWTSTHRPKLMGNCANAWVNLSCSYGQLGCYLKSSKAARRGIDLAEKFPRKSDDILLSTDDVRAEYMRACHSLGCMAIKSRLTRVRRIRRPKRRILGIQQNMYR